MFDHTYNGTPTAEIPIQDIYEILADGGAYDTINGRPVDSESWFWIKLRLEVEIVRRQLGIPIRSN